MKKWSIPLKANNRLLKCRTNRNTMSFYLFQNWDLLLLSPVCWWYWSQSFSPGWSWSSLHSQSCQSQTQYPGHHISFHNLKWTRKFCDQSKYTAAIHSSLLKCYKNLTTASTGLSDVVHHITFLIKWIQHSSLK